MKLSPAQARALGIELKALQRKRAVKRADDTAQRLFLEGCKAHGLPEPVAEYQFHPTRRWRLDWAWVAAKLALEIQGGLFSGGRHVRGAALLGEHEKLNAAAAAGWRVLFVTPQQVEDGSAFAVIRRGLGEADIP